MTTKTKKAVALLLSLSSAAATGCGSGSTTTYGTSSGAYSVACTQKVGSENDSDCKAMGLARKLDCDSDTAKQQALSMGCKEEKPGDNDVCCPSSVTGIAPGGTSSSGSSTSSGGETCDLKKESWYSDCSKGCGDIMVCQSFCSDCSKKCMVGCETNADCEAVGAGRCEISAKASNRCSGPPTKCR